MGKGLYNTATFLHY